MKSAKLIKPFRIDEPKNFRLADHDPADTRGLEIDKQQAKSMLAGDIERLADLQEMLYAQAHWAVLAIFQAMDAGGKDSAIKHVMTGVNPQGCEVHAFKAPSAEELEHDFLRPAAVRLPPRGRIGIFNRSYYEEVLVVRVRPELLGRQKLPPQAKPDKIGVICRHHVLRAPAVDPTGAPAWHREGCSMCQRQLDGMWERSRNPKLRRPAGVGTQSPEFDLLGYDGIVREQSHRNLYVCPFDKLFRLAHPDAGRGVLLP